MSDHPHIRPLSYLLVLIAYMTLTLSLTLVHVVSIKLDLPINVVQFGLGVAFVLFSVSAIVMTSLSEVFGSKKILMTAQLISIAGLVVFSMAHNAVVVMIGFVLLGFGTGCYSSSARSMLTQFAESKVMLGRSFAVLSATIILAPIFSSFMGRALTQINWRLAYLAMASIELFLLVYARYVLTEVDRYQHKVPFSEIKVAFTSVWTNNTFLIGMLKTGLLFSIYLSVIVALSESLFVGQLAKSVAYYNWVLLLFSCSYLVGVFLYRSSGSYGHRVGVQMSVLALLSVTAIVFSGSAKNSVLLTGSLIAFCFFLGFMVPAQTSQAMGALKKYHSVGAANVTFIMTLFMAFWSFVRSLEAVSPHHFMILAIWVSLICVLVVYGVAHFVRNK